MWNTDALTRRLEECRASMLHFFFSQQIYLYVSTNRINLLNQIDEVNTISESNIKEINSDAIPSPKNRTN